MIVARWIRSLVFVAAAAASARAIGAQNVAPLRVIRTTPGSTGGLLSEVTVTFDRPVAGSLDHIVDPASIFRVQPAIRGRLEWRDPVTIRLKPAELLPSGTTYTVTVANSFRAMDGSTLAEPFRFTFRVAGPTALFGSTGRDGQRWESLALDQPFDVVYSAPIELAQLSTSAYVEFSAACAGGSRMVRLRATGQRRMPNNGLAGLREYAPDESAGLDSLRRIVHLVPEQAMPRSCDGDLVVPKELGDASRGYERWKLSTHGDFRIGVARCDDQNVCPRGPVTLTFTTPVRGSEVQRYVKFVPDAKITIRDTSAAQFQWVLDAKLEPWTGYALVVDTAARDVFGQRLAGNPAAGVRTTGFAPSIDHAFGRLVVERAGLRTLSVQHINVDTLITSIAPIADSLEARVLTRFGWANDTVLKALDAVATTQRIPLRRAQDRIALTGVAIRANNPRGATFYAVRVKGRTIGSDSTTNGPIALVQVTDLGVHARVGTNDGAVWVTGVNDGMPKQGATVVLYDSRGNPLDTSRTDARGLARLGGWATTSRATSTNDGEEYSGSDREGYVKVTLGDDRAITTINNWDPDLSPWRFNVYGAWGDERVDAAGAVFTERGIYRPGERVYAKAIVRHGALGALRAPAAGDSIKWRFRDRDGGMLREITTRLTSFGTSAQVIMLPNVAPIGHYSVEVLSVRQGTWRQIGSTAYRVAEYRPPEFLVDVTTTTRERMPGDTLATTVQARYLFGAPMARAAFAWTARQRPVSPWDLTIPGMDGWYLGETGTWWEDNEYEGDREFASGTDTLDARGERALRIATPTPKNGRPTNVTVQATVIDINRQTVASSVTALVHPADFYVAAKMRGSEWFWRAGTAQSMDLLAVRPDGRRVPGIAVRGALVRHEWHRVRRERDGAVDLVGEWVRDTVDRCSVTTATDAASCTMTPRAGGSYTVIFTATDAAGRTATTSFGRWASGSDWVPWSDETQFKMDVVPDKARYAVGDTATILFASPFTNAEAWITVEREGLIDQRRVRITSGATTLKFPITEAYAPNVFVSIIVARGRSAPPGSLDDPGRPTMRVGYAELRVTPEVKRLAVTLANDKPEYRPGDSARVRVRVQDALDRGARSEVTLWAVDAGVLSLTGYKTPDPIDLVYRERGLGMRLASNMTAVAPQVPEGDKGRRDPGGGGGAEGADVLRSRFQTTAFFLGTVVTDAQGNATATVKLPDNITTFRVMAVAVTAGDRYGKGETSMLVTRPLLARQALPRFVRPGDRFNAGAVINRRDGAAVPVTVRASATGVTLQADSIRRVTLAAGRGTEVRFPFTATRVDSASFRFDVAGDAGNGADAVRVTLPVRPDYHPRAFTAAGLLRDTATVDFTLPSNIDPARSRLSLSVGSSPLAMIRGIGQSMRVYPYYCTEQVISAALPLVSLYRAQRQAGTDMIGRDPRPDITRAAEVLIRRQRTDGGIGYWSSDDWTTAWLSSYAGMVLLEARDAGVRVDTIVFSRLADFLSRDLHGEQPASGSSPVAMWYDRREARLRDQIAALDFLSRLGRPDVALENEMVRNAAMLALEDRARLAEVLARRRQTAAARRLMTSVWSAVRVEGNRATIPDSMHATFYFNSYLRPIARVLTATLAVDPRHPLIGPLVESLAQPARVPAAWSWNTQDYAAVVIALADFERVRRTSTERQLRVTARGQVVLEAGLSRRGRDSTVALTGLLSDAPNARLLRLALDGGPGDAPIYYYLTVSEIPTSPPVTPDDRGIRVERWYERFQGGNPVTTVAEGDLVRVRLRVTVPTTRQFVVLDDALPAGLEAIDLSLRTASLTPGPGANEAERADHEERDPSQQPRWGYGSWDSGWWSPFDHREIRDDRVVYSATVLWPGTYTATYIARATTPGTFIRPPVHAEEMYNPAVNGRSDGGTFVVTPRN